MIVLAAGLVDYVNWLPNSPDIEQFKLEIQDTIEQLAKRPLPLNSSTIDPFLGSLVVDSSHI